MIRRAGRTGVEATYRREEADEVLDIEFVEARSGVVEVGGPIGAAGPVGTRAYGSGLVLVGIAVAV